MTYSFSDVLKYHANADLSILAVKVKGTNLRQTHS